MKPITPSGTRTREISIPFGRRHDSTTVANRIGQRGDLTEPLGHALDARLGERQAVEERLA